MSQQATRRQTRRTPPVAQETFWNQRRLDHALSVVLAGIAFFLCIALFTYHPLDPAWSHARSHASVRNWCGAWGAYWADILLLILGYVAYLIPLWCIQTSLRLAKTGFPDIAAQNGISPLFSYMTWFLRAVFCISGIWAACLLCEILWPFSLQHMPAGSGGVLGQLVYRTAYPHLHFSGLVLLGVSVLGTALAAMGRGPALVHSAKHFLRCVGACGWRMGRYIYRRIYQLSRLFYQSPSCTHPQASPSSSSPVSETKSVASTQSSAARKAVVASIPTLKTRVVSPPKMPRSAHKLRIPNGEAGSGLPALDLLEAASASNWLQLEHHDLQALSQLVEQQLADFHVKAHVVAVQPGPVITRFELQLAPGVKASKVTGLAKDLARALSLTSVRVVEVIPGKPFVGLEIPNHERATVRLREILESTAYQNTSSVLALALGKDIAGEPVVADLAKMPHLLVAGTTGSGKSVGVNAMLLSLLFKCTPRQLRLLLIDPKMLELSVYEGIPHLLAPVVTDMRDAAHALKWCVLEMERRYRLLSDAGVRHIAGYNDQNPDKQLPYIVVCIDEFADMIMVVGKKVEDLIARIAQKARASGIHLILATQRPSVDVITGLIKANIPSRIAFQVSSRIDSRTILDQSGAEQLLGHGDMLYLPPGTGLPSRVHGAFVADAEVHALVQDWKQRGEPEHEPGITEQATEMELDSLGKADPGLMDDTEHDALYDEAVVFVLDTRRASASAIQRRFKIGYNRAARLIEHMEKVGLVSPMMHSGAREVLVPKEEVS